MATLMLCPSALSSVHLVVYFYGEYLSTVPASELLAKSTYAKKDLDA